MKIAVTGATGFLGRAITAEALRRGHQLIILTRRPGSIEHPKGAQVLFWDSESQTTLPAHDAVINLAGESIACHWDDAKEKEILRSRQDGTRKLIDAIGEMGPHYGRPRILVNASAVGYYGDRGEEVLTEQSTPATDYLARVCSTWEKEAVRGEQHGLRVTRLRIGVVLGSDGGALDKFLPPFRLGLGGPLGSGHQWFPWVHIEDVANFCLFAVENDEVAGAFNMVAPGIVRGRDFAQALGKQLGRPAVIPVPVFVLRILLGEFGQHLVDSQHVVPQATLSTGYTFHHPDLPDALENILVG